MKTGPKVERQKRWPSPLGSGQYFENKRHKKEMEFKELLEKFLPDTLEKLIKRGKIKI